MIRHYFLKVRATSMKVINDKTNNVEDSLYNNRTELQEMLYGMRFAVKCSLGIHNP